MFGVGAYSFTGAIAGLAIEPKVAISEPVLYESIPADGAIIDTELVRPIYEGDIDQLKDRRTNKIKIIINNDGHL